MVDYAIAMQCCTGRAKGEKGLNCRRVHAQALLVLDDQEFHERQDMLSLGQHRAIATALNSLVFHTHCPAPQDAQKGHRAPTKATPLGLKGVLPWLCSRTSKHSY